KMSRADNPDAIEYVAPDYGINADAPDVVVGGVTLVDGKTPRKQLDGPAYIFTNIFGLKGIRIELEGISPMALAGGMESSNAFNIALFAAASMLSGANLSWADIFAEAVRFENNIFGGLTGGQGHLSSILGGAYRNVWLSGVKDDTGELVNPYAAYSIPFIEPDDFPFLESHMMLVQAGKEYLNGKAVVARTAAMVNNMWTDLIRDDTVGFELHSRKLALADKYIKALMAKDMATVVDVINEYVDIRDELQRRWFTLALMPDGERPSYADKYKVALETDEVLMAYYAEYGYGVRNISPYSDSAKDLIQAARAEGIAIMPLGAGGPGANMIAISSEPDVLRNFLEIQDLSELNEPDAQAIIHGTGTLKGYMPFKIGREPVQITGFGDLGIASPSKPIPHIYNEISGEFDSTAPFILKQLEALLSLNNRTSEEEIKIEKLIGALNNLSVSANFLEYGVYFVSSEVLRKIAVALNITLADVNNINGLTLKSGVILIRNNLEPAYKQSTFIHETNHAIINSLYSNPITRSLVQNAAEELASIITNHYGAVMDDLAGVLGISGRDAVKEPEPTIAGEPDLYYIRILNETIAQRDSLQFLYDAGVELTTNKLNLSSLLDEFFTYGADSTNLIALQDEVDRIKVEEDLINPGLLDAIASSIDRVEVDNSLRMAYVYDPNGNLLKVYDMEFGIVWEEYSYNAEGLVEWIKLLNPSDGKIIRLNFISPANLEHG
ncbi:MAG: hypothetical protein Q8R48_08250, partial [Candidatus Omnitrophota bacterium]|nr:hypothetical protein [Candidatus Omnitrophota bacterium]